MIIYVASYPRSGNFWLQNLLANQFKRLTTNLHEGANNPNMLAQWTKFNKEYYDINVYPLDDSDHTKYGELFSWMVSYQSPAEEQLHKGILPGFLGLLKKTEIRTILSNDHESYFLKTHFYPDSEYLEGEYVIQIIRNPGACLWSYYNFKRDLMKKLDVDLTSLIRSDSDYGSWSQYHLEWTAAARKLGSRYLSMRYEDLFGKEIEYCERLQSFLDLQVASTELRGFDFYHEIRPALTREGKADDWEKNYSKDQLKLLWDTHRDMMTQFGYSEPNYDMGMDNAQH